MTTLRPPAVGMTWLASTLDTVSALTALIGSGSAARAWVQGRVPPNAAYPYLTVLWHSPQVAHPIGASVVATEIMVDIALWDQGDDDTAIQAAFAAVNAVLEDSELAMVEGKQVGSSLVADLPPAPPPQTIGEPVTQRVGATYSLFIANA